MPPSDVSNPFEYQEPLVPDTDWGLLVVRQPYLRQALQPLRRGGFVTVSAPPHSGVTTFLYSLRPYLPRVACVDLANLSFVDDPPREAARVLAKEVAQEVSAFNHEEDWVNVADVLTVLAQHQARADAPNELLTVIVDGFDAWSDESARKLVLALRAAYTESRTRGSTRSGFSIITGSSVDLRDLTASGRTSPLNIAQPIFLPDLTKEEVTFLFTRGLAEVFSPEEIIKCAEHAYNWTQGHPAMTQLFGYTLFECGVDGQSAQQAREHLSRTAREEVTSMLGSTLGMLNDHPELLRTASRVYGGAPVPFDRIHRPIRDLQHLGLIRPDETGMCEPRNPLFADALAASLNLSEASPSVQLWNSAGTRTSGRAPGTPTTEILDTGIPTPTTTELDPHDTVPTDSTTEARLLPVDTSLDKSARTQAPKSRRKDNAPLLVQVGAELGGCRIVRRIGRGAMSEVYLAQHLALETKVAIKVLRHSTRDDKRFAQRFLREARAAAQLSHENIVQIRNVGRQGELRYIEMEYLPGGSVSDLLRSHPYPDVERAAQMLRDACAGLNAAHIKSIIHRDVKPDNLMMTEEGKVKVVDFGLASILSLDESKLTQEGTILGTPHYMAPEQWEGQKVDERSDVYSLGAALYHLLTGSPPFDGKTIVELISNFTSQKLVSPRKLNRKISSRFARVLTKMLAKDPEERYASMADVLLDCQKI